MCCTRQHANRSGVRFARTGDLAVPIERACETDRVLVASGADVQLVVGRLIVSPLTVGFYTSSMAQQIRLEGWTGPWPDDDPDANLKSDIALYSHVDPLLTVRGLSESTGVPVGAIVHYVLARWASEGASGLLELGPTMTRRLQSVCTEAEALGTDDARLRAYDTLRQMIGWLSYPLEHPDVYDR